MFNEETKNHKLYGNKGSVDIVKLKAGEFEYLKDKSVEERRHLGDMFVQSEADLENIYDTKYQPLGLELRIPTVFVKTLEQGSPVSLARYE